MLSEEHKKMRLGKITSSVAAAVLDMDDWSSQYDALLKIRGEETFEGNEATERGNLLEPALLTYAAMETGVEYAAAPFVVGSDGWSGDSADGTLHAPGSTKVQAVIEAKTVNIHSMDKWGEPGTDDVPERVLVQAHWHLIHWPQADVCYVPVLFGGSFSFKMYVVPRDKAFEDHIYAVARDWHARHVVGDEPVPIGSGEADRRALLKKAPRDWGEMLACDDKLGKLLKDRLEADKALKAAEKARSLIDNLLREALGEHEGIDAADLGLSCTYRKNKDGARTDWQAVARELRASEELIYRHTRVEPGARVLKVARKRAAGKAEKREAE